MRKKLLSLLFVLMTALAAHSAATVVMSEGFESGIPAGWTQQVISVPSTGGDSLWVAESANLTNPAGAYEGTTRLAFRNTSSRSRNYVTRLISPVMNCAVYQPVLTFAHAQAVKGASNFDQLKVYYRTGASENWQLLVEYTNRIDVWQYDTVDLIAPNATYQLAFEANVSAGAGIVLDDMMIAASSQCTDVFSIGVVAGSNTAALTIGADLASESFQIAVVDHQITDLDNFNPATEPGVAFYDPLYYDFEVTATGLMPQTNYYAYVRSACSDNLTGYTNWVGQPFRTSCGFPFNENFSQSTSIPAEWTRYRGELDSLYNGGALETTTVSGGWAYASGNYVTGSSHVTGGTSTNYAYMLMTPAIDLTQVPSDSVIDLRFNLGLSTSASGSTAPTTKGGLRFYVVISEDGGASWSRANTTTWSSEAGADFDVTALTGTGKRFRINMNAYRGEVVKIAFVTYAVSGSGYFHMDDITIHTYDAQCGDAAKLFTTVGVNSVTANWTIFGKQNAIIQIATDAAFTALVDSAVITTGTTYTFTGLQQATNYYVRVKQDCDDAEWIVTSCRTATGIPYANPFTSGTWPVDWGRDNSNITPASVLNGATIGESATSGWSLKTVPSSFTGMTGYAAYCNVYSTKKNWMISPTILVNSDPADHIRLSFLMAVSKSSSSATAPVYTDTDDMFAIMISQDGGNTWTQADATIWDCVAGSGNNSLTAISEIPQRVSVDLTSYRNQTIRIAIFAGSVTSGSDNYVFINNLTIDSFDPNCGGLSDLAIDLDTYTASWQYNGTQSATILVSTNNAFTDTVYFNDAITATSVVLPLNPNTKYYLKAQQNCADADWSYLSFKTPCGVINNFPWVENFNSYSSGNFTADCWVNQHITGSATDVFQVNTSSPATSADHALYLPDQSSGNQTMLVLPAMNFPAGAKGFEFSLDIYRTNNYNQHTKEGLTVYASNTPSLDSASNPVLMAVVPRVNTSTEGVAYGVPALGASETGWFTYTFPIPLTGTVYIIVRGDSYYGNSTYADNFRVAPLPTCDRMGLVTTSGTTSTSTSIGFAPTTASQYQIVVTSASVDPDSIGSHADLVVYNDVVSAFDNPVSGLNPNTTYYVYVRGFCGGDDYGAWSVETSFRTLCDAMTPEQLGEFDFTNAGSFDCWTTGFLLPGSSSSYAHAERANKTGFGYVGYLSKESTTSGETSYSDGAYMISPELNIGNDTITKYQVSFSACTNTQSATNVKKLQIGIVTSPDYLDTYEVIKTITLEYANDSTQMTNYVVSLADYIGDYNGEYGRYIMFSSQAADSLTNYVLIDNIVVEAADGCPQLIETEIENVTLDGATFSWENSGAASYEVMVTPYGGKADTIAASSVVFSQQNITAQSLTITGLNSSTVYYAYVRGVCNDGGESSYSRWSGAKAFKTALGIPFYDGLTNLNAWQSLSGKGLDIMSGAQMSETISSYKWTSSSSHSIAGIDGTHAAADIYSSGSFVLVSDAIDMSNVAGKNIALNFLFGITPYSGSGTPTVSGQALFVMVSTDNGATWPAANAYEISARPTADIDIADFAGTAQNVTFYLNKFGGQTIKLAFAGQNIPNGSGDNYFHLAAVSLDTIAAVPFLGISGAQFSNATLNSVDLTFLTKATDVASFEYMYCEAGADTTGLQVYTTTDTTVTVSGLNASSAYDFYVRGTSTSGQVSEWVGPFVAKTALGLPYQESWNYTTIPAEWSLYNGLAENAFNGTLPATGTGNTTSYTWMAYSSSYGLDANHLAGYIYKSSYSAYDAQWIVSPTIDLTPNTGAMLTYSFNMALTSSSAASAPTGSALEGMEIRMMVSTDDGRTWTAADSWLWNYNDTTGAAYEDIRTIPANGRDTLYSFDFSRFAGHQIRIAYYFYAPMAASSGSARVHVANLMLREVVAGCEDPSNLTLSDIEANSVNLAWEGDSTKVSVIQVATAADFTKGVRYDTVASGLTCQLQNLKSATTYYVRVKQLCADDNETVYTNSVNFTTSCIAYDLPYEEGFENMPVGTSGGDAPTCWITYNTHTSGTYPYAYVNTNSNYVKDGSKSLYFVSSASVYAYALLPELNADLNNVIVEFDMKFESTTNSGYIALGYFTDPSVSSSFQLIRQYNRATSWAHVEEDLTTLTATIPAGARLALRYGGSTSGNYYAGVDNIVVHAPDLCPKLESVEFASIDANSLTFVPDTANYEALQVIVAARPINPDAIDSTMQAAVVFNQMSSDTIVVSGLQPQTPYQVYVRTNCGADVYGRWTSAMVTTPCVAIATASLPYVEDFNSYSASSSASISPCWTKGTDDTYTSYPYPSSSYKMGNSGNSLYFYTSYGIYSYAALPLFEADIRQLQIKFQMYTSSIVYAMQVGVMTDPNDVSTFTQVANITNTRSSAFNAQEVSFAGYQGQGQYIAFLCQMGPNEYGYVYIDNVEVGLIPDCQEVASVKAENVGRREMDIVWTPKPGSDNCQGYQLVISTTALADSALNAAEPVLVDTTVYHATGLDRGTKYYFYVRSDCGAADGMSGWVSGNATTTTLSYCDDIVIADGTSTNSYVPIYGFYADSYCMGQSIYPASMLTELVGQEITSITYYISSGDPTGWGDVEFELSLGITAETDFYNTMAFSTDATNLVYTGFGDYDATANTYTFNFDTPFTYNGGNLVVDFTETVADYYETVYFYGINSSYSSAYYGYSGSVTDFLPKFSTQMCHESEACPAVETVTATLTGDGTSTATVEWTASAGDYANTYDVLVSDSVVTDFTAVVPQYDSIAALTLDLSGLSEYVTYYVYVRANCDGENHNDGSSTWNYTSFTTNSSCPVVHDLTATVTGKTTAEATWNVAYDGQDSTFCYILSPVALDSAALAQAVPTPTTETHLYFNALTSGTTYYLYVASVCAGIGQSPYLMTSFEIADACAPVENLTVAGVAFNAVTLTWNRNRFGEETAWEVGIVGQEQNAQVVADSTAIVIGLTAESAYTAYVRAICSATDTSRVATVAFTTAATPSECLTVGEGTTSTYGPACGYYGYERTGYIFTPEDGLYEGTLTSISWNYITAGKTIPTKIYMKNTTDPQFDIASNLVWNTLISDATLVYDDQFQTDADWMLVDIDDFNYTGANLMILVQSDVTGSGGQSANAYFTSNGPTNSAFYGRKDNSVDDDQPISSMSNQGVNNIRPNTQFCFATSSCSKVMNLTATNITTTGATISWYPGGSETRWNTYLSTTPLDETQLATVVADTATALTKALTGLTPDADYYFYIRALCSASEQGAWKELHFITVATCLVPANLGADSIAPTSAVVHWSDVNAVPAGSYTVIYGPAATFDIDDNTTYASMDVTDTTALLQGLSANSLYAFSVRTNCDVDSRWAAPVQFLTDCGANTIYPWTEDFNSYSTGNFTPSCWINEHISGTGSSIFKTYSTTYGQDQNYTTMLQLPDMSSGTMTKLVLPEMSIDSAYAYEFRITVDRNASGSSYPGEGVRIFASTTTDIADAVELGFISRNRDAADLNHGVPSEGASGWYTYGFTIPMAGNVYIIIRGESMYGSSTYMDDFKIRKLPDCGKPHSFTVTPAATSAELAWETSSDMTKVVVYAGNDTVFNATIDSTNIALNDLGGLTRYTVELTGMCADGGNSDLTTFFFSTTAGIPFIQSFNVASIPTEWTLMSGSPANAFTGAAPTATTSGWLISTSSNGLPANHARINIYSSNKDKWLVSPVILAGEDGDPLKLSFDFAYTGYNTGATPTTPGNQALWLLISEDGGVTWNQTNSHAWCASSVGAGQEYPLTSISPTGTHIQVEMSQYAGKAIQFAFVATETTGDNDFHIANVELNTYNANCLGVENVAVSNVSATGATLSFNYVDPNATQSAVVVLTKAANPDYETAVLVDTITTTTYQLPALDYSSTYYVFVAQDCGTAGLSAFASTTFTTPIGVPYHPTFGTSTMPEGWSRSNTEAAAAFAGTALATYTGGWNNAATDEVIASNHVKVNVYGSSCHYWLITPSIDLTPNVGEGLLLTFDAALCDYANVGTLPEQVDPDDNFMVVVSADGGTTWQKKNATLWQDTTTADYRFSDIPVTGATYHMDMSGYAGKVIKIGFYAESSVYGADNDLHVGNIHLTKCTATMYTGRVCEGQTYSGNGFVVDETMYEVGENAFSRYTPATATTEESLEVLALTVDPAEVVDLYATVCQGEPYTIDENVYLEPGEVEVGDQTIVFYLTSTNGCDSTINLHVTGLPASHTTEQASTCNGTAYEWHGHEYYLGGTYNDTLQNVAGCDSIVTLLLTVDNVLRSDSTAYLCYMGSVTIGDTTVTEAGDYIRIIPTEAGCDAEVTYHVVAVGKLESHKCVVMCQGSTYSDALVQGLTSDFHNSVTTTSVRTGCDSTVIYDIWFADTESKELYVVVPQNELPFIVNGVVLLDESTAKGQYDKNVTTDCGTVVMHITVGDELVKYTITVKAENGTATGSGVYEAGSKVNISVTPFNGYKFLNWDDNNTDNPRTITVTGDATYTGICVPGSALNDVEGENDNDALKLIEDEQLIIIYEGVRYNAQGARIE